MYNSNIYRPDDQVVKIQNGGLFNRQRCQRLAKQVFEMYNDNKDDVLTTYSAGKMLMDLYRSMNKQFHPQLLILLLFQEFSIEITKERLLDKIYKDLLLNITVINNDKIFVKNKKELMIFIRYEFILSRLFIFNCQFLNQIVSNILKSQ